MVDWVTIKKFAEDTGLTPAAITKAKVNWPYGIVWIKVGDRVFISRSGWNRWLDMEAASARRQNQELKSNARTTSKSAGKLSSLSPQPLTFE
jgi:hypothetical protein